MEGHDIRKAAEKIGEQLKGMGGEAGVTGDLNIFDEEKKESIASDVKKMASEYAKVSASAKEAMGLTDAMVEGIYGQAYRLYNTGKYKEASQLFRLLIMLDAKEPKYMLGLAASFHMLKEFKNAISVYTLCSITDPESPIPHYHVSDCLIQMGDKVSAIVALEMAITRAGDKPEYQMLKDRAQLTIENLKRELTPKEL